MPLFNSLNLHSYPLYEDEFLEGDGNQDSEAELQLKKKKKKKSGEFIDPTIM
jgi:hypothetical protein